MRFNAFLATIIASMCAVAYAAPVAVDGNIAVAERAITGDDLAQRGTNPPGWKRGPPSWKRGPPSWKPRDDLMTAPGWKRELEV